MPHHIYEKIEVTGSSTVSSDDAIANAVASVAKTHRQLRWLEVVETRCHLQDDKIAHWQVTVKVGINRG
ncbi:dodecin [Ferrimonas senticii]|uniref:dodecin n=1 Tax=Ferrimonas senticii TaxID=394566 RepID=UPI000423E275|nr:dodecin [Ferrimonas senticii]